MAKINLQSNVPLGTLDASINDVVTSLSVGAGEGATFPAAPFVIGINDEAMLVTAKATDTFTVTRGYVSTTAASHTAGDTVTHVHTHENLLPRDDTTGAYLLEADLDTNGFDVTGLDGLLPSVTDDQFAVYGAGTKTLITQSGYTVSADSSFSTQVPGLAVDGNTGTYWQSNGDSSAFYVDLGAAYTVSEIRLWTVKGTVDIHYSDTGTSGPWTEVYNDETIGTQNWFYIPVNAGTHQYWRLSGHSNAWWQIWELEFYTESGTWVGENVKRLSSDLDDVDLAAGVSAGDILNYTTGAYTLLTEANGDHYRYYTGTTDESNGIVANAFNNTVDGIGWNDGDISRFATVDLGYARTIGQVRLRQDTGALPSWTVRGSNDNATWTNVLTGISNSALDTTETWTFSPATFRYWGITSASAAWAEMELIDFYEVVASWQPTIGLPTTVSSGQLAQYSATLAVGAEYTDTAPTITSNNTDAGAPQNWAADNASIHKLGPFGYAQWVFPSAIQVAQISSKDTHGSNWPRRILVQYSPDSGTTWIDLQRFTETASASEYNWTLTDKTNTSTHWRIWLEETNNSVSEADYVRFNLASQSSPAWNSISATAIHETLETVLDADNLVNAHPPWIASNPATGDTLIYTGGTPSVGSAYAGPAPIAFTQTAGGSGLNVWPNYPSFSKPAFATAGVKGNGMGWEFAEATGFGRMDFDQHPSNYADNIEIWTSDDGTNWDLIDSFTAGATDPQITLTGYSTSLTVRKHWHFQGVGANGSGWEVNQITIYDLDLTPGYDTQATAFVDNAGTFEAQGPVDMNGFALSNGIPATRNGALVYLNSDQSINDAEATKVQFNQVSFEYGNVSWDATNYRFVVSEPGIYSVGAFLNVDDGNETSDQINDVRILLYVNGVERVPEWMARSSQTPASFYGEFGSSPVDLNAGDYVEIYVYADMPDGDSTFNVRGLVESYAYCFLTSHPGSAATHRFWNPIVDDPLTATTDLTTGSGTWSINTYLQCVVATSTQCRVVHDTRLSATSGFQVEVEMEVPTAFSGTGAHLRVGLYNTSDSITSSNPGVISGGLRGDGQVYFEEDGVQSIAAGSYTNPAAGTWVKVRMMCIGNRFDLWFDDVYVGSLVNSGGVDNAGAEWAPYIVAYNTVAMTARFRNLKAWEFNLSDPSATVSLGPIEKPLYPIDEKATSDTPDDEFNSGTLNGKWTAVSGTSGTVSFMETGNVNKYDLNTRSGTLLLQVGATAATLALRQDYTLADGEHIVAKVSPSLGNPADTANNELILGIGVNNNDTDYDAGDALHVGFELDANETNIKTWHQGTGTFGNGQQHVTFGVPYYLRIGRAGNVYHGWFSMDGSTWVWVGSDDKTGTTSDNIWIFCEAGATTDTPVPIQAIEWIRLGTNALDPW